MATKTKILIGILIIAVLVIIVSFFIFIFKAPIQTISIKYCKQDSDCIVVDAINGLGRIPKSNYDCGCNTAAAINQKYKDFWEQKSKEFKFFCKIMCKLMPPKESYEAKCVNSQCVLEQKRIQNEVTIATDKTEYEQGETIEITIKNNLDKVILGGYVPFYAWGLEKFEGNSWKKFPVLWKSDFDEEKRKYHCSFFSPEQPVGVKKWGPYSGEVQKWDSRICSPGLYEEPTLIEEGVYRLVFTYSIYKEGQIPKAGYYSGWDMEDPKVIYSNEFTIKEKK